MIELDDVADMQAGRWRAKHKKNAAVASHSKTVSYSVSEWSVRNVSMTFAHRNQLTGGEHFKREIEQKLSRPLHWLVRRDFLVLMPR